MEVLRYMHLSLNEPEILNAKSIYLFKSVRVFSPDKNYYECIDACMIMLPGLPKCNAVLAQQIHPNLKRTATTISSEFHDGKKRGGTLYMENI